MAWRERLYERPLRKALDDPNRSEIQALFERRKGEIPFKTRFEWHPDRNGFALKSSWATFQVRFTEGRMVVDAELSFAARIFATDENRALVRDFIDGIVDELHLCEPKAGAGASIPAAVDETKRPESTTDHAAPPAISQAPRPSNSEPEPEEAAESAAASEEPEPTARHVEPAAPCAGESVDVEAATPEPKIQGETETPREPAAEPSRVDVTIDRSEGAIKVTDPAVFGPGTEEACDRFLARVLALDAVELVSVDRDQATATIRLRERRSLDQHLQTLAGMLREGSAGLHDEALPAGRHASAFEVSRRGGLLTTWTVISDRPGRLKLRHEGLKRDRLLARRVERVLKSHGGVVEVRVQGWRGFVAIRYVPRAVTSEELIALAEEALEPPALVPSLPPSAPPVKFGMANLAIGVTAATDFFFPVLMPASIALLVGANYKYFRAAAQQLRQRQIGVPVLYTALVGTTILAGQFFAWALMTWAMRYWQRTHQIELDTERQLLLEDFASVPQRAKRPHGVNGHALVPVRRLRLGERITLSAGETLPVDGRVRSGEAVVDESVVGGPTGGLRKRLGDPVHAGSSVLFGRIEIEVSRLAETTRAAAISRAFIAATSPHPERPVSTGRTARFADKAVAPTLATAGFGMFVGDAATAVAILRADYGTGPGLAISLQALRNLSECLALGLVVRDPDAFDHLAEADLLVIEDRAELRRQGRQVALVEMASTDTAEANDALALAGSLGRFLPDDRAAALVEACRTQGIPMSDLHPTDWVGGINAAHQGRALRLIDYDEGDQIDPVELEIDGVSTARFRFRESGRPASAEAIAGLRDWKPLRVVILSDRPPSEAAYTARLIEADEVVPTATPQQTAHFLRLCRDSGRKVAFVGDCRRCPEAVAEAHVAISTADEEFETNPAPIVMLRPDYWGLPDLWRIATTQRNRHRSAQRMALVPNLFCVAGVFLFGFTSLMTVAFSNLGTFGNYLWTKRHLKSGSVSRNGRAPSPRRLGAAPHRGSSYALSNRVS